MCGWGELFQLLRAELLKRTFRLDEKSRIGSLGGQHWLPTAGSRQRAAVGRQ
jgi:hypothetical protein